MKNQVKAGTKRPVKTLQNQPAKAPVAPPDISTGGEPEAMFRELACSQGESLWRKESGELFLASFQKEWFDGKSWRPFKDELEATREAGIPERNDHAGELRQQRTRSRRMISPVSVSQARQWVVSRLIPLQLQYCFAPPLAGEHGRAAEVKAAAERHHLDPDAFVCEAVDTFLRFLEERPDIVDRVALPNTEELEYSETLKWEPTSAAHALFYRLHDAAMREPMSLALARLRELRDLVSAHPGFYRECQELSRFIAAGVCAENYANMHRDIAADSGSRTALRPAA